MNSLVPSTQAFKVSGVDDRGSTRPDIFSGIRSNGFPQTERRADVQVRVASNKPRPLRILLVDDQFANRCLIGLILNCAGHQVVTANHGGEAVEYAKTPNWDVILMDLQMPVMDGWQATESIRRNERTSGQNVPVPIIALTASRVPGDRKRCFQAGMDDFLPKPIDPKALVEMVQRHGNFARSTDDSDEK